jgi:hypothetical protein
MDDLPAQSNTDDAVDKGGGPPHPPQINSSASINPGPQPKARKSNSCRKLRKAPIWIEAACAIGLVIITAFYTHYAKKQAEIAQCTLGEIIKQFPEIQKSASAAKSAAETSANQLELTERPWVDASITIDGPFSFGMSGDSVVGAGIPLKILLRNTGNSPALGVFSMPILTFAKGDDILIRRDEICEGATKLAINQHWGITLFPKAAFEERKGAGGGNNEVGKGKVWRFGSGFGTKEMQPPSVIVCIAYRPTFNKTSVYHTAYIFDLLRLDSTNTPIYFKIGENVDQEHLLLRGHEMDAISAH